MCKWRLRKKHQCKWPTSKVQCKPRKTPIYPRLRKGQLSSHQRPKEQLVFFHQPKGLLLSLHRPEGMPATTEGCHTEGPDHKGEEDASNKAIAKGRRVNPLKMIRSHLKQSQRNRKRKMTSKSINGAPLTRTISSTSKVARTKVQRVALKGEGQS